MVKALDAISSIFYTRKISDRFREIGIALCLIGLMGISFTNNMIIELPRYLYLFTVSCLFFGGLIFFTNVKKNYEIKFRVSILIPWLLTGISIVISGVLNTYEHLPNAILILIVFPVLFYTVSNYSFEKFILIVINVVSYTFGIVILVSLLISPINAGGKYIAIFNNSNGLAQYLTVVFACLLIKILISDEASTKIKTFNYLLIGGCLSFLYFTNSRTGQLACIIIFVTTLFLFCIKNKKIPCKKILLIVLTTAILMPAMLGIMNFIDNFEIQQEAEKQFYILKGYNEEEVSNLEIKQLENKEADLSKLTVKNSDRYGIIGKTLSQISSGRTYIWNEYIKELNYIGHDDLLTIDYGQGSKKYTAHMVIIEHAYNYGIFAGVLWLLVNLLSFIYAIKYYFKNENEISLVVFAVVVGYLITSLLASIMYPIVYFITLIYYLVLTPLFIKTKLIKE